MMSLMETEGGSCSAARLIGRLAIVLGIVIAIAGIIALAVVLVFRHLISVHLEATAVPDGAWSSKACGLVPNINSWHTECLGGDGSAAFQFTVRNVGGNSAWVDRCTAIPVTSSGTDLAPVSVPIGITYGNPYPGSGYASAGESLSLRWFARGVLPQQVVAFKASCSGHHEPGPGKLPVCLPRGQLIGAPSGPVRVQDVKPGMLVYGENARGATITTTVLETRRVPVPSNDQVVAITLADGRSFEASFGHPTADGRIVGELSPGDPLDGSTVVSVVSVPYAGGATYDLLTSGVGGTYFVDGVLLGSTLAH